MLIPLFSFIVVWKSSWDLEDYTSQELYLPSSLEKGRKAHPQGGGRVVNSCYSWRLLPRACREGLGSALVEGAASLSDILCLLDMDAPCHSTYCSPSIPAHSALLPSMSSYKFARGRPQGLRSGAGKNLKGHLVQSPNFADQRLNKMFVVVQVVSIRNRI